MKLLLNGKTSLEELFAEIDVNEVRNELANSAISNPNWVALSFCQWLNRNKKAFDFADSFWLLKIAMAVVAPLCWVLKRFGMGEELCLKASRPIKMNS
jgi:hypothetical protein